MNPSKKIFFYWIIETSMCFLIGLYFNMGLAILIAILTIPLFIHDILLLFCKNCENKHKEMEKINT